MKKYSQGFLFFIAFCFVLSVIAVSAQKNKKDDEVESPAPKVEVKNDPPPAPEPTKSEPSSSPSYSSSDDTNDSPTPTSSERTTIRNERRQRVRRERQRADIERRRREAAEAARRNSDEYENCPTYGTYGDCYDYTDDDDSSNSSNLPWAAFYGRNDIAFINYDRFADNFAANYSPYFEVPLRSEFTPLHGVGFFEPAENLPYNLPFWSFYYEPDLDFLHIDFKRISESNYLIKDKIRFDRLVINAVGKRTLKRVGKTFTQKGTNRPVIVEDISTFALDRIYAMNLNRLPKGTYELRLISKTGDTIKLPFRIK